MLHSLGFVNSSSSTTLHSASLISCGTVSCLSSVPASTLFPSFPIVRRLGESLHSDMRPPWILICNVLNPAEYSQSSQVSPGILLFFVKGQITWLHCSPQGLSFRRIVKMLNLRLNSKEEVVEEEEKQAGGHKSSPTVGGNEALLRGFTRWQ